VVGEDPVQKYDDLVELARICFRQASTTKKIAAAELRRMAKEYQRRTAKRDDGKAPSLSEKSPSCASGLSAILRVRM
jgi:hypothetical protein